jgi:ubiquinone biosynthesis protein
MTLYDLVKNHKHRERLREIIHVFFEQEFGFLISKIKLHKHLPFHKRIQAKISREKKVDHPTRLRLAFEELGPTFIKFGQLLSLRPDLIPEEFAKEFEKMQDKVPAFSFEQAKAIIEKELGRPLNKIFSSFNKKPLASASMGQVYKAKLGTKVVAVKVQRPNIEKKIETDIELMYKIVELIEEHVPELREFSLHSVVHEFEKWTIKELNFKIEAHYADQLRSNFKGSKILKIPLIYHNRTTNKVLTMEFIDGVPLHDIETIKKKKYNIKQIIRNGYYVILKQVFVDGFFHADPHPGNILVLKGNKIGLIDYGIIGHFNRKLKNYSMDLFNSFINNEPDKAVEVVLKMNPGADINKEAFSKDVRDIFEQLRYSSPKDLLIGQFIKETIITARKHHIAIPVDFTLYGKTIAILEGIALKYDPDFNFDKETKDTFKKLLTYKFFAKEVIDKTKIKVNEYQSLVENFPETAKIILERAKQFKLNLDINDTDVGNLTTELERSSGNVSLGFIVSALIVASALVLQTNQPLYVSKIGFLLAGILGLWLIRRTVFVKKR